MLKIGDFSKLAQVTVKTLRHYGELGLLKPAWIDRYTGYRYYALEQLPRLNRILALKDLGFTLEQIALLLDEDLSIDQMRGIVLLKRAELEQRVQAEQQRLNRVEARLAQIEHEGKLPDYEIVIKRVSPQVVAGARDRVEAIELLPEARSRLCGAVDAWLNVTGNRAAGPWLALYDNPEYFERNIALEMARALEGRVRTRGQGIVTVSTLPGVETMASIVHANTRADWYQAMRAFYAWAEANAYRVCGPAREVYLEETAAAGPDCPLVEHQFPVEPFLLPRNRQKIDQSSVENSMEPKIVTKPAFLVAGMLYQGKNENQEISQLWGEDLLPRIHEIKRVNPYESYGVCLVTPGLPEGEFQYIAGGEIADPNDVPEGMVSIEVPEQRYAVFAHRGSLEALADTYAYIYQSWLPQSGYKTGMSPDFEHYTSEFNDFSEDSILYLYIPIGMES